MFLTFIFCGFTSVLTFFCYVVCFHNILDAKIRCNCCFLLSSNVISWDHLRFVFLCRMVSITARLMDSEISLYDFNLAAKYVVS